MKSQQSTGAEHSVNCYGDKAAKSGVLGVWAEPPEAEQFLLSYRQIYFR